MPIEELFREAFSAVTVNKVRSGLTMLGIVIGIGSVIALISIGQGAQGSIAASIQSIGSNLIVVSPSFQRTPGSIVSSGRGAAQTLTQEDADAISSRVTLMTAVAPQTSSRYQIKSSNKNTNTTVIGTVSSYPQVRNLTMEFGTFISDQNVANLSKVAVLGPTTAADLFGSSSTDPTGETIRINNLNFKVIGVTRSKGGNGFGNQDDVVYVPLSSSQRFLQGGTYVSTISIEAQDAQSMSSVQSQVTDLLLARHNISDPTLADFTVQNQQDIVSAASSVTNTFTILLASIAGISLIVGGIGIMNMMLTTVTERTREIGLRKAIGAKKKDISIQFLLESVMLTFFGGGVGVVLGWIVCFAVSTFAGIATSVSWWSVFLAFGVSAGIGIVFGYYPARRAAGLNPIEALRYE
jgi:putative ABC transport system permease protein